MGAGSGGGVSCAPGLYQELGPGTAVGLVKRIWALLMMHKASHRGVEHASMSAAFCISSAKVDLARRM